MFLGAGVGAYANGMFHLLTHAFFKALLFMTAGLAIHAIAGEQDIRKLRGIGRLMPFTKWCFLVGALALVGIPPFSGFFSKDSIVASAAALGTWYGWIFWLCGIAGAFLTGLYTFRLWFLVFPGEPSAFVREHYHDDHGREGAWSMLAPVGILAVLATIGGWLQWSPRWHPFTDWLEPAARTLPAAVPTNAQEYYTSAATVIVGLAGIVVAWAIYSERTIAIPAAPFWRRLFENKFYFDALYDRIFYAPAAALATGLRREFEEPVVLQTGTDIGETTLETGGLVRRLQTGLLRTYVLFLAAGAAAVVLAFLIAK
jgi:NADH-quinone oxidoreductase subunit L